jgi:hypothetical protein
VCSTTSLISPSPSRALLQDPDDEIINNLASLKNGVAMRVVLGDLSWKMLAEPQEYVYAAYLKAELPHRELETAMLEEVSACACWVCCMQVGADYLPFPLFSLFILSGGRCDEPLVGALRGALLRLLDRPRPTRLGAY